ncbi:MAG: hypothetical protein ACKOC5_08860, partial [Chloroflexota bacterium]
QGEREWSPKPVDKKLLDPDLQKAHKGELFDLGSKETDTVLGRPIDLSGRYGNDQFRGEGIDLTGRGKKHIRDSHPDQADWLSKNQDLVLKAIDDPLFVDVTPRLAGASGWNIAHIVYIGQDDYPFLNVVLNFHSGQVKVWTMFKAPKGYVYAADGNIKTRWRNAK